MKTPIAAATLLFLSNIAGMSQKPVPAPIPENLKPQFAIINNAYPNADAKKFPKAPADSVWVFRSFSASAGTVEVAFQGADVVYMIFRRGTGGTGWKPAEIKALHLTYYKDFLKETYDPQRDLFSRYNHAVASQINGAIITRKDFDAKSLLTGS